MFLCMIKLNGVTHKVTSLDQFSEFCYSQSSSQGPKKLGHFFDRTLARHLLTMRDSGRVKG